MTCILLCAIVLTAGPSTASDQVYSLILAGGITGERDLELFLDVRDGNVQRAFAMAPQFNKVSYRVDAKELSAAAGRLTGQMEVTVTSDGYHPPPGCTDVGIYAIDANVTDGRVVGAFRGTYRRMGDPASPSQRKDPSAADGKQKLDGTVTGTVTAPPPWGRNIRVALYLDHARAQPAPQPNARTKNSYKNDFPDSEGDSPIFPAGKLGQSPSYSRTSSKIAPRWNLPGFLRLTTADGKAEVATLRGFGGHPINYFSAEVTGANVTFSGDRLAGTVDALSGRRTYRFTLDADVIGDRLAGRFTKVVDGKPDVSGRLLGSAEDVSDVAATDAVYYLVLDHAVAARDRKTGSLDTRQMILHLPCTAGRFRGGVGFAGTYNHTYYDAESAGLRLDGRKLTGTLGVTVNPDPYVPPDGKAVACQYAVDAEVVHGSVIGSFSGNFGPQEVAGRLSGEVRRRRPIPEPMHVHIKLDDGAAGQEGGPAWHRRCYLGFIATDGKATAGSFSNNKGGFRGRFLSGEVACDGERFDATVEAVVDESRTVQVGRHTFRLRGKVIGLEVVGQVETLFENRPWKQNTAFMGSLSPVRESAKP